MARWSVFLRSLPSGNRKPVRAAGLANGNITVHALGGIGMPEAAGN